ncbi:MAG: S8 family serine peptidase [Candidatus Doudnabacteria bacterium]|nr:S8 family serine peptidase [Candidatus Doudnabacteria bacterium]
MLILSELNLMSYVEFIRTRTVISMGTFWFSVALAVALATVFLAVATSFDARPVTGHAVVLKVKNGASLASILPASRIISLTRVFHFSQDRELSHFFRLETPADPIFLESLAQNKNLEYFEREKALKASEIITSDPQFTTDSADLGRQWWLAKVQVTRAWEIATGTKDVTVAVLDTGINGKHEDLSDGRVGGGYASYCQVPASMAGQCLVHIASTVSAGENTDDNGHGTIIAGIIGAIPNNTKGIAGINWNVRLVPVKVLDSAGNGTSADVAAGIVWAADNGAQIINLSLGGAILEGPGVLSEAISYAYRKSVLVIAAAGNDSTLVGADLDTAAVYPVCSDGEKNHVLGVAAVDIKDRKAGFSNFGSKCIDLVAPGTTYFNSRDDQRGIISTYYDPKQPGKNNLYVFASGSSMAAPMVSGVAALLKSKYPDLGAVGLRSRLTASAADISAQNLDACAGQNCAGRLGAGRLDALGALQTVTFLSNSIIRDSAGQRYVIVDGLRRSISEFVFKQRGFVGEDIKEVSVSELELLPASDPFPPVEGTLLKSVSNPTVFVVRDETLLPLSFLAFRAHGYTFANVTTFSDKELGSYNFGSDLVPADGALLKLVGNPAVYYLKEGKRRLLSAFVFHALGLKFTDVVDVSNIEFERYREDSLVPLHPPPEGSLIKGEASATVYVIENGVRRPLSAQSFAARAYQFAQVNVLPESEMVGYQEGAPIL